MNPSSPETTYKQHLQTSVETNTSTSVDLRAQAAPEQPEKDEQRDPSALSGLDDSRHVSEKKDSTKKKNVPRGAVDAAQAQPFFDAWAEIGAPKLGSLRAFTPKRVKAVEDMIATLGADALPMFRDAVTFVTTNARTCDFWTQNGYGFDNLINERGAKVAKYAEAYAATRPAAPVGEPRRKYEDD